MLHALAHRTSASGAVYSPCLYTPDMLGHAKVLIAKCQMDLGYRLTDGQRHDLLMDNTAWDSNVIRALVSAL